MRTRLILIGAVGLWCCLIVATPLLASGEGGLRIAGRALYVFFSPVCHQWDSHSFHLCGEKFPVCIRCSAIYFGFLCGIVLYPTLGRKIEQRFSARTIWIAAAAGMIIDVALSTAGISDSSAVTRVFTGGVFGILAAFVLTSLLQELIGSSSVQ